ncbi:nitroreductase/quinone reductase family protein [Natronolimnobius sp. AArcel1]|uniref:nitroreductase/quinone reductase family protein n=1 Tax=Natronolimnobius sp. AArcel1 TaxID=1679093 RepID=UPI001F14D9BC|nr:nitroreductase/quinone reductase family protein [Natronolimnobius sp. AArcel1]
MTTAARTVETRVVNPLVCWLLQSPVHWLASVALVLLTYRGQQSGRGYTIPIAYARADGSLVAVTPKAETIWWTNFRQPTACTLHVRGEQRLAAGELIDDDADRAALLAVYARQRRILARLLGIDTAESELAVVRFSLEKQ